MPASSPTRRPSAVLFDVNETLLSLEPLAPRLKALGLPATALSDWLARVLRDGFALAASGDYADFRELGAAAVHEMRGAARSDDGLVDRFLDGFGELDVHDDVELAFQRLRESNLVIATLTNGSAAVTRKNLETAGCLDFVQAVMDVSEIRSWKPRREAYLWAVEKLGLSRQDVALVSVHPWDVHGARRAGLTAAWLDREARSYPAAMEPPDVQARTLPGAVELLLALPERG